MTHLSYDFHGVHLSINVDDPAVRAAVVERLSFFAPGAPSDPSIRFDLHTVAAPPDHPIDRPASRARPVYDWGVGEVSYFDDLDVLYATVPDHSRVLVSAPTGQVTASTVRTVPQLGYLLSRPLFTLPLVELLKRHGLFSLHAATLAVDGRAILFAGPSGSGKSTLAVALARTGFDFLSDDMVFLAPEAARVHAFPDEADVSDRTAAWFPELESLQSQPRGGWPKHRVRVDEALGAAVVPSAKPAALVFPRVSDDGRSVLEPLPAGAALVEIAPNVLLTDPRSAQEHLDVLGRLTREVPCYRLSTGRDFSRIASDLRELLTR